MLLVKPLLIAALLMPVHETRQADGNYTWSPGIQRNNAGESCCGPGDCFEIPGKQITTDGSGYWIDRVEHVPFGEVLPSQDGAYWRCRDGLGQRRCFFAPPPSY